MIQQLPQKQTNQPFSLESAPVANPVFYRTYSRRDVTGQRESWQQVSDRTITGLATLGKLTETEIALLKEMQNNLKCLSAGRWLWVGGTAWLEKPANFPGAYNCSSTEINDWRSFGLLMDLAMMGCGTGAVLEPHCIAKLPVVRNHLEIRLTREIGTAPKTERQELTTVDIQQNQVNIRVGDSRVGWVSSYQALMELAADTNLPNQLQISIDLSNVRPAGERLQGFGGVANPAKLPEMYERIAKILNRAISRQLTAEECCLLIDEAAVVVVAGNVRRSAGMRQFACDAPLLKTNLWQQGEDGQWRIDPDRDALRMANHTRVFHHKPSREEVIASVREQYYSGEGAIQWAGEAVARANADLLDTTEKKQQFLAAYTQGMGQEYLAKLDPRIDKRELEHRVGRYGLNPCGEIIMKNNFCNLSEVHLNCIDPMDYQTQEQAFRAGGLAVAALLHHRFNEERYQYSREIDPIVGVSFTGLFDFCVHAFGVEWLQWWQEGRPDTPMGLEFKSKEQAYLQRWRQIAESTIWEYCDRHGIRYPNRCTTVQPAGTKSLLTGASPGWHPPKAVRFIRRVTFRKNDPVALACLDYGYRIVPSQSDKDDQGNLLNDPFDPRCTEWLVEIPVAVSWADLPGADQVDISQFSALAQFDFYMQVQRYYTTHNTSATIELRESEVEALGDRIYTAIQNDEGYISAALLARFDDHQAFPRLPFEPISKAQYEQLVREVRARRKTEDFYAALLAHDQGLADLGGVGPASCDSDRCLMPEK